MYLGRDITPPYILLSWGVGSPAKTTPTGDQQGQPHQETLAHKLTSISMICRKEYNNNNNNSISLYVMFVNACQHEGMQNPIYRMDVW